jgi:putative flippase GtrA
LSKLIDAVLANETVARLLLRLDAHPWGRRLYRTVLSNRREVVRFLKFATVGVVGTVVDFSVLNVLVLGGGFTKFWANTCSFSAAVVSNFIWNRLWTFPESRQRGLIPQLLQFSLVSVGGYVINQIIFLGLDGLVFHVWGTLGYNISKAIATIVVLVWNFGMNRMWTYGGID